MSTRIFGQHLLQLRKAKGWNKSELARQTGLTPGHVSQLEANKRQPSLDTLCSLKHGLQITWDELMNAICEQQQTQA